MWKYWTCKYAPTASFFTSYFSYTHFLSHAYVKLHAVFSALFAGGGSVSPDHPGGGRVGPALPEHLPSGPAAGAAAPRESRPAAAGDLPVRPGLRGQHTHNDVLFKMLAARSKINLFFFLEREHVSHPLIRFVDFKRQFNIQKENIKIYKYGIILAAKLSALLY